jgi:hypothetical protein
MVIPIYKAIAIAIAKASVAPPPAGPVGPVGPAGPVDPVGPATVESAPVGPAGPTIELDNAFHTVPSQRHEFDPLV